LLWPWRPSFGGLICQNQAAHPLAGLQRHKPPSTDAVGTAERNDATAGNEADPDGRLPASASRCAKALALSIKPVMAPEKCGALWLCASKIPACGTLASRALSCAATSRAAREPAVVLSVLGWLKQPGLARNRQPPPQPDPEARPRTASTVACCKDLAG
jgi:hypothetical protein